MFVQVILMNIFVMFVESRKGKLTSKEGTVVAYVDSFPFELKGEIYFKTVRTTSYELLVQGDRCNPCKAYQKTLRLLYGRWSKRDSEETSSLSSHTNVCYLTTPEKRLKICHLTKCAKSAEKEVERLQEKVAMLIKHADELDPQLHHDLVQVMEENSKKN